MNFNDYKEQVISDACDSIEENIEYYDNFENMFDECLWIDDAVTGNGSGSYTFNTYAAQENIKDALFDDNIAALIRDYDGQCTLFQIADEDGAEAADVTIRCLMLLYVQPELENYFNKMKDGE